jgi:uncharacterized membrane protein
MIVPVIVWLMKYNMLLPRLRLTQLMYIGMLS